MPRLLALEAVVFDLDGTLLDRRLSFERFMRDQWTRFSRVLQSVDQAEYVRTVIELDRDGYAPRKELFAGTLARFQLSSELAETLLRDYRAGFPSACVLFPDAAQTLSSFRAAGLRLGLITNGSVRMQSSKLNCLALAPAFDTVLISDAEGVSKPDPEIFRRALERLSTSPERAVFVGHHPEVDVSGERRAGMKAVWRRDRTLSRTVEADAIIEELGDLLSLLGLVTTGRLGLQRQTEFTDDSTGCPKDFAHVGAVRRPVQNDRCQSQGFKSRPSERLPASILFSVA